MTALKINVASSLTGDIQYRVLRSKIWSDWGENGAFVGAKSGQKIEAIKVKLTGKLKKEYDVYYRIRIKTYGWTGWAKNGQAVGSQNYGRQMIGLQVKLVKKEATDQTIHADKEVPFLDAQKMVIQLNKQKNCVTVYQGSKPIKAFICSTGKNTPLGTYYTGVGYRWRALFYGCYGQYSTQITGNFLFHSVPYDAPNNMKLQTAEYNKLGTTASHGCVRLTVEDSKWIYDNCLRKTKVIIYNSEDPGPLGRPKAQKLPKTQTWDPTDKTVNVNKERS